MICGITSLQVNRPAAAATAAPYLTSAAAHPAGAPCNRCRPTAASGRRQGWRARTGSASTDGQVRRHAGLSRRPRSGRGDGAWLAAGMHECTRQPSHTLLALPCRPARPIMHIGGHTPCPSSCALAGWRRGLSCGGLKCTAACVQKAQDGEGTRIEVRVVLLHIQGGVLVYPMPAATSQAHLPPMPPLLPLCRPPPHPKLSPATTAFTAVLQGRGRLFCNEEEVDGGAAVSLHKNRRRQCSRQRQPEGPCACPCAHRPHNCAHNQPAGSTSIPMNVTCKGRRT